MYMNKMVVSSIDYCETEVNMHLGIYILIKFFLTKLAHVILHLLMTFIQITSNCERLFAMQTVK